MQKQDWNVINIKGRMGANNLPRKEQLCLPDGKKNTSGFMAQNWRLKVI